MMSLPATPLATHDDGPGITCRSLHRFFHSGDEETQALSGVSVQVRAGEFVALIGPSGCGKSTLLACLAGLDEPDGGSVHVGGVRISRRAEAVRARLRARNIGVLTQQGNLFEHLTVAQNIRMSQRLARRRRQPDPLSTLDELGIRDRAHARPDTLSGGENARASLAVALANDPQVLLADEPTGELDSATEGQLLELVRTRADGGVAVLIASHSAAVAEAADRVITMTDGVLR